MPWSAKGRLGVGTLVTLSLVAACTIEVNINTKADEEPEPPLVTGAPEGAADVEAPSRAPVPPPPAVAPRPPAPEPVAGPDDDAVRDALFRFRQEQAPPPPPEPEPRELGEAPTFTPFTKAPSILNRADVIKAMMERYPPLLRDAGIGGTARVYFYIEADGSVGNLLLDASSGHRALDDAALAVAEVFRFSPATNRDVEVPVWVSFPITFQVR